MAMKRMMKMNILNGGKKTDEGRYRANGDYDRMHEDGEYKGREMRRGGWENSGDMGREEKGRYRGMEDRRRKGWDEYDDDNEYEGGGGRYAGNFRHREDSREHEAGKEVKFDEHKAREWVQKMENSDGTRGEHFRAEQAEQMRMTHCPMCDKTEFWAAMNMMYSDYCEVAKKMGMDKPEFYAHMAKAFLTDKDAGDNKLAKYMKYIAKA